MYKIVCTYEMNGVSSVTEANELCQLRGGFWIDEDGAFCQSIDARIFIMPHMIREIRKEKRHLEKNAMLDKLERCGCGGDVEIKVSAWKGVELEDDWFDIECTICHKLVKFGTDRKEAIDAWNKARRE